jgi:hypothetical protein
MDALELDPEGGHAQSARPLAIADDVYCPDCAQNLRGTIGTRCPECGSSIEDLRSRLSFIPWTYRSTRGWFRSYWRTVHMVMFKTRLFCAEAARPVDERDAQLFRWVTIAHAWIPALVIVLIWSFRPAVPLASAPFGWLADLLWEVPSEPVFAEFTKTVSRQTWFLYVLLATSLPWFLLATRIPALFFGPRDLPDELRRRAVALSYYASAPLALSAVSLMSVMAWGWSMLMPVELFIEAALVFTPPGVIWLALLGNLCRRLMPHHRERLALILTVVPLLWVAAALLCFTSLPLVAVWLNYVGYTLR